MHKNLLAVCLIISAQCPVLASNYDALCDGSKCTVSLDASGISSSGGSIPINRIAKWFTGGEESYSAAAGTAGGLGGALLGGVAGAVVLGPIGLLGGLIGGGIAGSKAGRSADLYFTVIGYNQEGNKTTISFNFVNPKPARKLSTELSMFSGLGAGQMRSIEAIQAAVRSNGTTSQELPDRLTTGVAAGSSPSDAKTTEEKTTTKDLPDKL